MFEVIQYREELKKKWDEFIDEEAMNGTFLQSKNFLDYHPKERFRDNSLVIDDGSGNTYCAIPGCVVYDNGQKVFISHKGSTYGGFIINRRYYQAHYVQDMINLFEGYLKQNNFDQVILKITPDIFCKTPPALLEYLLKYNGYDNYEELSAYVDLTSLEGDFLYSFNANKRKLVRRMVESEFCFRELEKDDEIEAFHEILCKNLSKHNAAPIHSVTELLDFKNKRLCNNVKFFGVFYGEMMLAAGMMFQFPELGVAHAQNLSTDPFQNYGRLDPITFLYYGVIKYYRDKGYKKLSWGISTNENGNVLNWGLIKNKESYGSIYSLNKTFYKRL
ncbi:GNAT family N-acetyltransferase [Aminipila terrae]|uniref:GNAT family N-acetyltransferase n=1 Tax=Aminipila terrae TaxID=2697030 RepID=A0A6P1MDG9_9FIRM|nr:GNAT family N-acetyltransferase [Aminipila terrae]QHI72062.1 GNAT family N-acetyltransferase [Aminipila terrae]